MEIKRNVTNKRAVLLLIVFIFLFVILLSRIVYIQVTKEVRGQDLEAMAEDRWGRTQVLEGVRGTIYDRSGGVIAKELESYTVYAILSDDQPSYVSDPEATAKVLAPYIAMDEARLKEMLSRGDSGRFQVELGSGARNLTHKQMEEIKALELDGIKFREEPKRYYPKQTYASHIIGYTERNMAEARMGLELSLDEWLRPEDGFIKYKSDRKGVPLPDPASQVTEAKNGQDVYVTLDSSIQTALEQVMTQVEEEYDPEKIIAIVADPKTGQILAMSNRPSFNPNEYEQITNYQNYAISESFEPGSTTKMFMIAAAIEEGVYNGQEEFMSGQYKVADSTLSDHNRGRGWGMITYDEGFLRSSNVALAKIALEKLGTSKVFEYFSLFGFDQLTGIDLPNEANSLIARPGPVETATTAFGQGTAVTAIQQIQAATAIANDGKMMKPYVIDRIVDPNTNKVTLQNEPEVVGEPISKETAKQVRELLGQVVSSSAGTGKPYYIEGFDVAGKTGTAQIPNPNGGGYLGGNNQNIFSFLGMAPKDDPSVVVYVAVDRPKLAGYETGSVPTSKIFNSIMKHSLQYLNITPTASEIQEEANEGFETESYIDKPLNAVVDKLSSEEIELVVLGEQGEIVAQEPIENKGMLEGERLFLRTDSETAIMPDMKGWAARDVRKLSKVMDLNLSLFGNGFVTDQSIEAGTKIKNGDFLVIELEENIQETEELTE